MGKLDIKKHPNLLSYLNLEKVLIGMEIDHPEYEAITDLADGLWKKLSTEERDYLNQRGFMG